MSLAFSTLFLNPFRICRKFRGVGPYGETPLSTFALLAEAAALGPEDLYVELGSGRGKTCFWAALFIGCKTHGIELVPTFFRLSKFFAYLFNVPIIFERASMFDVDLSKATVIYLYQLSDWSPSIPKGARLITISEPLPLYKVIKQISVSFPWGETEAFIQTKI